MEEGADRTVSVYVKKSLNTSNTSLGLVHRIKQGAAAGLAAIMAARRVTAQLVGSSIRPIGVATVARPARLHACEMQQVSRKKT